MRLQRLGVLMFLAGVSAFALLHYRIALPIAHSRHLLHLAVIAGVGVGAFLMLLGTIVRYASTTCKPQYRADWQRSQWQVHPTAFGRAAEPAYRAACSNCRNPLVAGARFCPRCGASISSGTGGAPANVTRPPQAPQRLLEPMESRGPAVVNRPPGRKFGMFRMLLFLALIGGGGYVASYWEQNGNPPWEDWNWHCDQCPWTNTAPSNDSQSLPTAPDPRAPVASSMGQAEGCSIGKSWVETGVDQDGTVGIRVHATVYSANITGLRFGAHLRFADLSRVYATDLHYHDANGQATAMAPVPTSAGTGPIGPVDVTAFIPAAALRLTEGNHSLEALASLYDASNRPLGTCQVVPFTFFRGQACIARVQLGSTSLPNEPMASARTFDVIYTVAHPQVGLWTRVVVRLKDEDGRTIPGKGLFLGPHGEFRAESDNGVMEMKTDDFRMNNLSVAVPAALIPPGATAEITVCNYRTGATLSQSVSIKMP